MTDRRTFPANDRVACATLRGIISHTNFVIPTPAQISDPLADLCQAPNGRRDRQLVFGGQISVFEIVQGWAFIQSKWDGYVGYIPETSIQTTLSAPTHLVHAPSTHIYRDPDFKSPNLSWLPMTACIKVLRTQDKFVETDMGWIPRQHVTPMNTPLRDPLDVATNLIGTPYLWGGNSSRGVDCSGLVQLSLTCCAIPATADSDQQSHLGEPVTDGTYRRGDLLFWNGHVAWVLDPKTILHANAFHMRVSTEDLAQAIQRIDHAGDGPVTAHRRIPALG